MEITIPNNGSPVSLPVTEGIPGELCRSKDKVCESARKSSNPPLVLGSSATDGSPRARPGVALFRLPSAWVKQEHRTWLENRLELGKKEKVGLRPSELEGERGPAGGTTYRRYEGKEQGSGRQLGFSCCALCPRPWGPGAWIRPTACPSQAVCATSHPRHLAPGQ